jgi:hypothetical protein
VALNGLALFGVAAAIVTASGPAPEAAREAAGGRDGADAIGPFLARHCLDCHEGDKPKGDFRLDRLPRDLADPASRERWLTVLERVRAGEMPPEKKPRPTQDEIRTLSDWVDAGVKAADARRAAEGRAVLRRLNRAEYENTVRDLLGIDIDLRDMLPADSSAGGFDNVGDALHTSSFLMERYLDAADAALKMAVANGPRPPLIKQRYSLKDQHGFKLATESVYRLRGDEVVMFSSSHWNAMSLSEFYPPDRGNYRFRISAYGFQSSGKPVAFQIEGGPMLMGLKNHLIGYFDAAPDEPTLIEFVDRLEARSTIRLHPYGLATAHVVNPIGADKYEGPGLAVQWIEVEGPLHDTWPPPSHRGIFGELAQAAAPDSNHADRVEVVSTNPEADARLILRGFVRRAFRRAVTDEDVKPYVELVLKKLSEGRTFEQAVRVALSAVMVSPEFLFLREKPGPLDDFALASRLSYFLWSTMPDEELLALAERGELGKPEALRGQVERMLAHPKAKQFTENFVGQWLRLREIDFTSPDDRLYPEFDDLLKTAMVAEPHLFFDELLKNDLSLTNFVASDFTFLNGRLAKHYGVPGVEGHAMRKVTLPPGSRRGGVLTMAGVLKVTANGTNTSPVMRGAWVLDRILGSPPRPPPSGVAAIEPDIRGATTVREQLDKHKHDPACASCHVDIDPPGFALESFDVIGGWRESYRVVNGQIPQAVVDGRPMPYGHGPKVDPSGVTADGQTFADVDGFKQLLLADKDRLARALALQLTTYATGAAPAPGDRPEIEAIVEKTRVRDYGLRSLVHEVVQSPLFRNK